MINYFRPEILGLSSYTPSLAPHPDVVKLDAMESPFPLSTELRTKWLELLSDTALNRYPGSHTELHRVIRTLMGMDVSAPILLGNGSDELIQLIMLGLQKDTEIVSFAPSFVMYQIIAKWCNLPFTALPLQADYTIDMEATLTHIDNDTPQVLFIAYPNNPTGNAFASSDLQRILETNTLVVIDEAYYAYASDSFINRVAHYDNLIVLRTISKIGFAGVRLGMMTANTQLVHECNKLRMPYNVNILTMKSCELLLAHQAEIEDNAQIIIHNRTQLVKSLTTLNIITVYPTDANFILFALTTPNATEDAKRLYEYLGAHDVLVKYMGKMIPNALRVTVGLEAENTRFMAVLKQFVTEQIIGEEL